jgi:serine/threonine protein kinase
MPLSTPVPPGTILENRYDVVRFIGHGGFGRTYLVRDQHRFNELCVLKEFAPQVSQPAVIQKAEELFQREAGTLYKLSHPQIPEFRALSAIVYNGEKMIFLVEQFIDGHNYGEWVEQGHCLTEGQGLELLRDLLPVLSYIHGRGVIHRDISPDNLMYDRDRHQPILIDFGSVKQVTETALRLVGNLNPATQIHKSGYTPFEQIKGEAFPNSDLYALAVTLLVLMTGKPPADLYNAHANEWHWQSVLKLDRRFENVLHRMLARHTSDRYASADAVLAAIGDLTIGANPLPPIVLGRSAVIATPTMPPAIPAATPATPQTQSVNPAFSTIKTVVVAPAWQPPPPTQVPPKAQPPVVSQALPAANPGYAAHSPAAPVYQSPVPAPFAPLSSYDPRAVPRGNGFGRLIKGTILLPFRLIGWGFKLLWGAIRFVDKMFTWIFRLIMIVVLLGGAAIVTLFGQPDWLPNIALPSLPGISSSAKDSQGCRDLEGRATRAGLTYANVNRQVNDQFYKRHPQVQGRALTDSAADQVLRNDWCTIADDVLRKAER